MSRIVSSLLLLLTIIGCHSPVKHDNKQLPTTTGSAAMNVKALVNVRTYNHYNQLIGQGTGFYIARNRVVTPLSLIQGSYKVQIAPLGTEDYSGVDGFTAFSYPLNLVILQPFVRCSSPIDLTKAVEPKDTMLALFYKESKLFTRKNSLGATTSLDSVPYHLLNNPAKSGEPLFTLEHQFCGMAQLRQFNDSSVNVMLPASEIAKLNGKQGELRGVFDLATKSNKIYPSYKTIKGCRIVTDQGNITIRLFNETPEYRDNFIRLVSDNFYDSLLIHRVIKGFLIQTGAADTKYAAHDDVVGWQGPGYTLPLDVKPGLFHKRGAVASSKLPSDQNSRNRCDGSQFYIVSGRVYSSVELDDLEKSKKMRFTPEQRELYMSIGGAPHLDGDYTVFGEVTSGIELVDRLSRVETYAVDRPVKDIRVRKIELIK